MANTLQSTVNWAQGYIQYVPLSANSGDPAITIANMAVNSMMNAPLTWATNRNTATQALTTTAQDYMLTLADFGFLEKVSLSIGSSPNVTIFELPEVYNTVAFAPSSTLQRPMAVTVQGNNGSGSITFRFVNIPDQAYTATFIYQKAPVQFTSLGQGWQAVTGFPDSYSDIYNNFFMAEAFQIADDARASIYRARGTMALLAKQTGLSDVQRNAILAQFLANDTQSQATMLRLQQSIQARTV